MKKIPYVVRGTKAGGVDCYFEFSSKEEYEKWLPSELKWNPDYKTISEGYEEV